MNSAPFLIRLVSVVTPMAKQNQMLMAEVAYLRNENAYLHERLPQGVLFRPLTVIPGPQAAAQKIVAGFKPSDIRCVTRCAGAIKHDYRVAA